MSDKETVEQLRAELAQAQDELEQRTISLQVLKTAFDHEVKTRVAAQFELTDACAARDALARECNQLEADREYNARLVEERDKILTLIDKALGIPAEGNTSAVIVGEKLESIEQLQGNLAQVREELARRQESQAYTDRILRKTNDELAEALTQARAELAAVDEALGEFYCPVLDPETDEPCGSFYKDHGVNVMRQALEMAEHTAAEAGLEAEAQIASARKATEWLWGYYDGNTLRAMPGFEDDIRTAWDDLLVATDIDAAAKLLKRLTTLDAAEDALDAAKTELKRGHRTLTALGVPLKDENGKFPITKRVEQLLCTERQLRREAEQRHEAAVAMVTEHAARLEKAEQDRKHLLRTDGAQNNYIEGLRDRLKQAKQRAERAEALAALVTPRLAELMERLAWIAEIVKYPVAAEHGRTLAAQIREALDDSQA